MATEEDFRVRLREAGEAFFNRLPDDVAERMRRLFAKLDGDGDAKVSLAELERGCHEADSLKPFAAVLPHLFPLLDADSNGSLDFSECKALFLLLLSSSVSCSSCSSPLNVLTHFSCLDCQQLPLCFHCHPSSPHSQHRVDKVVGIADDPQLYLQRILMSSTSDHYRTYENKMNSRISVSMPNVTRNIEVNHSDTSDSETEMDSKILASMQNTEVHPDETSETKMNSQILASMQNTEVYPDDTSETKKMSQISASMRNIEVNHNGQYGMDGDSKELEKIVIKHSKSGRRFGKALSGTGMRLAGKYVKNRISNAIGNIRDATDDIIDTDDCSIM